jgi:hypothetical protein
MVQQKNKERKIFTSLIQSFNNGNNPSIWDLGFNNGEFVGTMMKSGWRTLQRRSEEKYGGSVRNGECEKWDGGCSSETAVTTVVLWRSENETMDLKVKSEERVKRWGHKMVFTPPAQKWNFSVIFILFIFQ